MRRTKLVDALGRAAGMLRREVTQRLGLRFAPQLRFLYDEGLDQTTRVEELLAEIEAEKRSR
jgi:ribosome-binding factor A